MKFFSRLQIKIFSPINQYCIQPYYRTYSYNLTAKQFRSLQITASVVFV